MTTPQPSTATSPIALGTRFTCDGTLDGHVHLREDDEHGDGRMQLVTELIREEHGFPQHEVILAMGNINPPITTPEHSREYKDRSQRMLGNDVKVLVAGMFHDSMTADVIERGYRNGDWDAIKVFWYGVSNDAGASMRDLNSLIAVLKELGRRGVRIPILCHAERLHDDNGRQIPILDRERYAVTHDMHRIMNECGDDASVTIEHVSWSGTVDFVRQWRARGCEIYGGIASQYLIRTHDDLFRDARFHSHELCWPIYKGADDQDKIREAALSGEDCFYLGKDMACHNNDMSKSSGVKITSRGEVCGGLSQTPATGNSVVIELFAEAGRIGNLNAFMSTNGMRRFGRTAQTRVTYQREDWTVPPSIGRMSAHGPISFELFLGGTTRQWKRVF